MEPNISKIAKTAAKWWADQFRSSSTKLDNGDAMTGALASMIPKSQNDETLIQKFQDDLQKVIEEKLSRWERVTFGVDYHPDEELWLAIQSSGIKTNMADLPWKTTMWVDLKQGVRVSCGYQASIKDIMEEQPTQQEVLDMAEPIEKLNDLKKYSPYQREEVYEFAKLLASRLNPQLVPAGFLLAVASVMFDIENDLEKYPMFKDSQRGLLARTAPQLAYATCPEWFAKEVEALQAEVFAQ